MLYQVAYKVFRKFLKAHSLGLILLVAVLICSCNQKRGEDFVKLDGTLEEVLPKITLIVPIDDVEHEIPYEIPVGNSYNGRGQYSINHGDPHRFQYTFHKEHVVEGNKYIFAVVSYNWSGTGTFYYLTAIDKVKLKSVDEVILGDRVEIEKLSLEMPNSDTVTINYIDRKQGTPMTEKPDNPVEKHYGVSFGKLGQYWLKKIQKQ